MPDLTGKRILMVIANRDFRDEEYQKPRTILEKSGAQISVASSERSPAMGMFGLRVEPDILLDEADIKDFDAVIFVGGSGASEFWHDPQAHEIAQTIVKADKVLGAICIAPVTLANAGVLTSKKATVWPSEAGKLTAKGVYYTTSKVEVDGKIITADGPEAAEQFGEALAKALAH